MRSIQVSRRMTQCCQFWSICLLSSPLFLLILISLNRVHNVQSFSCLDESGQSVDWFVVFKIPKLEDHPYPINTGMSYVYLTSKSSDTTMTLGKYLINEPNSIVGRTLQQVYSGWNHYTYLQYNDDPPSGKGEFSLKKHKKVNLKSCFNFEILNLKR